MTFFYDNVYVDNTAVVAGPYEKRGPLVKYFDKTYDDMYFGEKSFEKAEVASVKKALSIMMKKSGFNKEEFDVVIGGDLLNQIAASTYGTCGVGNGFIGIYGACSSSVLGMIIAANFIETKMISNAICMVSSHNMTSEKQFRYPTEYGAPRPNTATFTATGAACSLLINEKSDVKITSATLGKIIDYDQDDPNDMGRVMAPSAIDTLITHLKNTNTKPSDYDLIVTGDLGIYGREIVKDYMEKYHSIDLSSVYNDCGVMLYDLEKQKEIKAGGSGPVCSGLVTYGYIYNELKNKKLKKVLVLATGALFNPIFVYQKEKIYSICHAICLEAV